VANPIGVSQYELSYTASSDASENVGIEFVRTVLRDGSDNELTITTHAVNGSTSYTGYWTSPWFRNDTELDRNPGDVDTRITVVDEAGNSNSYTCAVGESCEGVSPPDRNLQSITLSLGSTTISTGGTTEATVTATYDDGSTADVTSESTITSNDTNVATVSGSTVTGQGGGVARITGEYDGETVDERLTVEAPPPEFTSLTAEVDIQEQQDRLRSAEFSYSLESSNTVTFTVEGSSETVMGTSDTVTVNPSGQQDLPVTLRGEIQGGECLEIEVPPGTNNGETFDLVADGTGC
jgi:hypothetical protein